MVRILSDGARQFFSHRALRGFEANPPPAADGREVSPFPHASEKLAGRPDGDNSGGKSIVSRSLRWIDAADRGGDAGRRPEGHPGRYPEGRGLRAAPVEFALAQEPREPERRRGSREGTCLGSPVTRGTGGRRRPAA